MQDVANPFRQQFWQQYGLWLDAALREFNERWGDVFGVRKYHQHTCPDDYDPGDLVEIAEDGTVYPHGIGGTTYITGAVTPWYRSPYYVD